MLYAVVKMSLMRCVVRFVAFRYAFREFTRFASVTRGGLACYRLPQRIRIEYPHLRRA